MSDQERLAVMSMELECLNGKEDVIVMKFDDADFIMKLAHEAIKYRNLAKEREDEQ